MGSVRTTGSAAGLWAIPALSIGLARSLHSLAAERPKCALERREGERERERERETERQRDRERERGRESARESERESARERESERERGREVTSWCDQMGVDSLSTPGISLYWAATLIDRCLNRLSL